MSTTIQTGSTSHLISPTKILTPCKNSRKFYKAILFPESVEIKKRFNLNEPDRKFVAQYLSQWPRETKYPAYGKDKNYYDAYCKFLLYGENEKPIPSTIRIFNKVGDAYGYLEDNIYFVDFRSGVEFMLSAVINTNTDGVYNDGKYEYHTLGFPFMRNLGKTIYKYERKRKRRFKPDLNEFKLKYDQ